jgi:hypothetical protein
MRRIIVLLCVAGVLGAAGCVRVVAPDRPIEINLNVNIRQEVVVRLEGQARDLLEDNPDLF